MTVDTLGPTVKEHRTMTRDDVQRALDTIKDHLDAIDAATDIGAQPLYGETTRYPQDQELYDEWKHAYETVQALAARAKWWHLPRETEP